MFLIQQSSATFDTNVGQTQPTIHKFIGRTATSEPFQSKPEAAEAMIVLAIRTIKVMKLQDFFINQTRTPEDSPTQIEIVGTEETSNTTMTINLQIVEVKKVV